MRGALLVILLVGCGPSTPRRDAERSKEASIVATERGPRGGHLVLIGEDGRRLADLTETSSVPVVDSSAAWSPDGEWILFASSRGRESVAHTSLWVVAARTGARPRRLTSATAVDLDPAWSPDGKWLVFASNRGGSFDLWRVSFAVDEDGRPAISGKPTRLTSAPTHERHPSVSPDRGTVYYDAGDDKTGSSIWRVDAKGGSPTRISKGPGDGSPRCSPDGNTIAFASAVAEGVEIDGKEGLRVDVDLYTMAPDGSNRNVLVREPYADQTGPRWSKDGRFVFATSIYRSLSTGKAVLGSVVFVDTWAKPEARVMRALHDEVVETRMQPTLSPVPLDAVSLARHDPYADALKAVLEDAFLEARDSAGE